MSDSNRGISPRGRLWWFFRMWKAYRKHDVKQPLRKTWEEAMFARRFMDVDEQWKLGPLS